MVWLDQHYPNWWQVIDLGTLDISDCSVCVLGQVFTGCIPDEERNQLVAQVALSAFPDVESMRESFIASVASGEAGGFNVLVDLHDMVKPDFNTRDLGFNISYEALMQDDWDLDYGDLLDEWTRVILQRRIEAHPDLVDLPQGLDSLRELVHN